MTLSQSIVNIYFQSLSDILLCIDDTIGFLVVFVCFCVCFFRLSFNIIKQYIFEPFGNEPSLRLFCNTTLRSQNNVFTLCKNTSFFASVDDQKHTTQVQQQYHNHYNDHNQLILKDVYDIVYDEYDLDCDLNIFCADCFNENLYNNGYYYPTTEPHDMLFCRYYPCTFYFVFCVLCFAT